MSRTLTTTDPRTGTRTDTGIEPTPDDAVDAIVERAVGALEQLEQHPRTWRADLLDALAASLDERRDVLVDTAAAETGLSAVRLNGELTRTTYQLRLFADAVREGGFLEAAIDHAGETPMGPQPDVRRMLVPIGPVAVFGSSNFPFAFSVPGGDTASALAAGNPVIVKAHSAHPLTSRASYEALRVGAERAGAPQGTLGIVYGQAAGSRLVGHPGVAAVGFTGSLGAATHLRAVIDERERPIPFYGELQSVNPLIVAEEALRVRGEAIATGLAGSVTGSAGQLCTKPGVAFVPAGAGADVFAAQVVAAMKDAAPGVLLNDRVLSSFRAAEKELSEAPAVESLLGSAEDLGGEGLAVEARVLRVHAAQLTPAHTVEAFGPLVLLVDYDDTAQLLGALEAVPDSLTATLHVEDDDLPTVAGILPQIAATAGRIVFNGYPTGVRVSWAQHHGGPWPATNSFHTSVGITAIRRFLRPLAWQSAPESLLPDELRDGYRGVPRRVDGVLEVAQA
ncbi:aldehyde dehydrogenase (NADP(+)) [Microbacterium terricola]|uniref:Aldehyde dehydrogenase n=1 Tax=Microbacterium terricola TaxID=344163 RepID=A0ABM8E0I1_9MICO|nr:aldehyde dehydrogenase (NADP(+)) [Microbacterium terricola]UYK40815.1 aldehyde dehydrogenase (NADP(+)) [Microbacterium terricola]BDV31437.1 aldehyde dehydrogenase [Microbacterium terricola]